MALLNITQIFFLLLIPCVFSIVCYDGICNSLTCEKPNCKIGQVEANGFCDCCKVCVEPLGENATCLTDGEYIHNLQPSIPCAEGLVCNETICRKPIPSPGDYTKPIRFASSSIFKSLSFFFRLLFSAYRSLINSNKNNISA